ncbi:hypothetical protein BBP00_00002394 [Phytophthora kernoviae]|uniref:Uncharacterized protein n=1 Tax=Phytophthora kernoviae TaxID=325452 RepID=A0A3F2RYC8_9STRA|nr:hypothetical protein BBP00_00002394 [Phytophthora kernoviae]
MVRKHFKEVASDATPETASDEMRAAVLKRKIRSPTARAMMAQTHYRFKMLLKYKMVRSGGCFNDRCRFCKVTETPQSTGFIACSAIDSSYSNPDPATDVPATTTPPSTIDTTAEAPATTTIDGTANQLPCWIEPSEGDLAVGVTIVEDASCASGGLGCITDVCRFCKVTTSIQSAPYIDCALIKGGSPKSEAPVISTITQDNVSTAAPGTTTDTPTVTTSTGSASAPAANAPGGCHRPVGNIRQLYDAFQLRSSPGCPGCHYYIPTCFGHGRTSYIRTRSYPIRDGDKSVGIRVIDDKSCSAGGLGCTNDHCRFCKILETAQSSGFEKCSTYGVEFPTMAPLVTSTGVCAVSSGDAAVGISAMTDVNCLYGGLGCFNDHCRFCKVRSTTQSEAFVDCLDNGSGSVTSSATSAGTPSPPSGSATSSGTSSTTADSTACSLVPADGDVEVGISIGTDATCSAGGLGCINNVCRFCRVRTTIKSAVYTDCALLGTSGATTETPAPPTGTPDATSDTPTVTTEAPSTSTETPGATTETPTEAPVSTDAPAGTTEAPAATNCSILPSVGDSAVGINIITDATCSAGGIGCIDKICRFCKVTTSTQSAAFLDCATFGAGTLTSEVPTVTINSDSASDDSDFSDASDADVPDATLPIITTTEAPTIVPDATSEVPTVTSSADTVAPATAACTQTASSGDAAVGIKIVTDASCSVGGAGCIDNVCRFCKVAETPQSSAFVECSSISSSTTTTDAPAADANTDVPTTTPGATTETPTKTPDATTETPTETPDATTETPTETPDATTEAPSTAACTQTVSSGDAAVGINIVTDASCSAGGAGCIDNVCRFCKVAETPQSSAFVECSSIAGAITNSNSLTADSAPQVNTKTTLATADSDKSDSFSVLDKNPTEVIAAVAAGFGVVAAVAAIAIAAKRSHTREAIPTEPSLADEEDAERGERTSSPASEEEPIIPTEA